MKTLHLNLCRKDFDSVKSGEKKFVFYAFSTLWHRILEGREFDRVLFKCCWPAENPPEEFACSWFGYEVRIESVRTENHRVGSYRPLKGYSIRVGVAL